MVRKEERPTTPPAFDVAEFAKESDARLIRAQPAIGDDQGDGGKQSERRLVTRPTMHRAWSDEEWAEGATGVPVVVISSDELRRLPLDHRAGFLLSLMDGTTDLVTVVELSPMHRADALRLVRELFDSGIIEFR